MPNLKHRDVCKLFPGDEEKGVAELGELDHEVDPADDRHSHPVGARDRGPVDVLTNWRRKPVRNRFEK